MTNPVNIAPVANSSTLYAGTPQGKSTTAYEHQKNTHLSKTTIFPL